MLDDYTAVLIAAVVGLGIVVFLFLISFILAPRSYSPEKASNYECGMVPVGEYWSQMHLRYYIFAILFMIFDVETVFLYPWAVVFLRKGIGAAVFYEMIIFMAILFFGLVYGWRRGVLRWQ